MGSSLFSLTSKKAFSLVCLYLASLMFLPTTVAEQCVLPCLPSAISSHRRGFFLGRGQVVGGIQVCLRKIGPPDRTLTYPRFPRNPQNSPYLDHRFLLVTHTKCSFFFPIF
jgi:hypothetical protein